MNHTVPIVFWNETAFALPYLVSLGLALTLFVFGTQRGHIPVAGPLAVYALLQAVWIIGFLEETFANTLEVKILWDDIQFIPFLFLPQVMLLTSRAFLGKPVLPLGGFHRGYLAAALLALAIISLDPVLHWIRPDARLLDIFPRGELTYSFTPMMYLMVLASYALTAVVLVRIWRHSQAGAGKFRKQGILIFIGLSVPVAAGLVTVAGFSIGPHRDITPLTFGLGDLIIVVGILRYHILDLVPIAIETAFQAMGDPIVIVDNQGTILAHNRSFAAMKGAPGTTLVGRFEPPPPENRPGDAPYDMVRIPMTAAGTKEQGVIWHFRDVRLLREAQVQQLERERLDALGRMANNLAHELNSPLASLLSASRFLQEKSSHFVDRLANDALSHHLVEKATVPDKRTAKTRSADRRLWLELLEAEGVPRAKDWAVRLTDAGILPRAPFPAPGWSRQPGWETSLENACEVASLLTSLWVIQESADRGERIISTIQGLEYSPTAGLSERVAFDTLLNRALAVLGSLEETATIILEVQPEATVLGNSPRLVQLCFQLLKNARQAAGPLGTIVIRGYRHDSFTVLEVEDSGPGIPEDQKRWIFSPFFTTRKAGEGSGLGLEIVKLVAKEHGAEVSFDSAPGRTIFRVVFPAN